MAFEVPPLPYDYNALEKSIDEQTMRLHHDKHHGAYVTNLNAALEKHPDWQKRSVEQVLRHINEVPEDVRTAVRNNGGGHANHSMFWRIMAPSGGGEISPPLGGPRAFPSSMLRHAHTAHRARAGDELLGHCAKGCRS